MDQKSNLRDAKHILRVRFNTTLKEWARQEGFKDRAVWDVVRGINLATCGTGRLIAERLQTYIAG